MQKAAVLVESHFEGDDGNKWAEGVLIKSRGRFEDVESASITVGLVGLGRLRGGTAVFGNGAKEPAWRNSVWDAFEKGRYEQ